MKRMFGFIGIIIGTQFIVSSAIAGTTWVSGVISTNTVWDTTGSPYIVTGDVLIDSAVTLDIEPGVEVRIDSVKHIMIKGTLNAIGTATDSIIISALDTTKRWSNLLFKEASAGSLKYCRIEYAGNSAIYDDSASSLYIGDNTIINNSSSTFGGGIYSSYDSPTITENTITYNSAEYYGGGIYSNDSATITGNTITDNSAYGGGGIRSYGSPTITENTITYNSAIYGGGIRSEGSPTITGNTITNNSAYYSAGGIHNYSGSPTITGNTIIGNSADEHGGGIYSEGSPTITGNTIIGNSADEHGGGIYTYYGLPKITGNTITGNSADGGGGIYSSGTITGNTITNNSANRSGGSIYGYGSPTIKYNTITDTTRSAIYIYSDSALIDSNNLYVTGYAVCNYSSSDIDARHNYWGTASSDTIDMKIWDYYDASTKGIVHYEPFLTEPLEFGVEEASNYQLTISNYQFIRIRVWGRQLSVIRVRFPCPDTSHGHESRFMI